GGPGGPAPGRAAAAPPPRGPSLWPPPPPPPPGGGAERRMLGLASLETWGGGAPGALVVERKT
ncbi:hypothetical protein, partial [Nocardia abscessus]|uniref:hypothetical protein n=1 Tax=Nocardia abscessus TaxID=120957 RepID=UPI0024548902